MDRNEELSRYHRRRDFERTPEPRGEKPRRGAEDRPVFVVQHHAARRDHFDFRLEVEGVLKSWAVPKGPSTDPRDKRLAIPTEDHPIDYADFEGSIPAGEYGGGTVLVWDTGPYSNTTVKKGRKIPMAEAVEHGHVTVWLEGEKISGGYALSRFRGGSDGEEEAWLLVKQRDSDADARRNPVSTRPESVRTGRELEEVAEEEGRTLRGHEREPSDG